MEEFQELFSSLSDAPGPYYFVVAVIVLYLIYKKKDKIKEFLQDRGVLK